MGRIAEWVRTVLGLNNPWRSDKFKAESFQCHADKDAKVYHIQANKTVEHCTVSYTI